MPAIQYTIQYYTEATMEMLINAGNNNNDNVINAFS